MDMTREELKEAIEEEQVLQTNRVLRWVIVMVVGGFASILGWGIVWGKLNSAVSNQGESLSDLKPKVYQLETWRERIEATRVTPQEAAALDKRIQRLEDQTQRIESQNEEIMGALRKIDGKLP
jgi:hypothetical protein